MQINKHDAKHQKQVTEPKKQACHIYEVPMGINIHGRNGRCLGMVNANRRYLGESQGPARGGNCDLRRKTWLQLPGEYSGIHYTIFSSFLIFSMNTS